MHIVNQANAMKLAKKDNFSQRFGFEDWSASTIDFKISVAAVKGEVDQFLAMMEKAVKTEHLSKEDLREWPVFSAMRSEKLVVAKFQELFGEPLVELESKN